MHVLSLHVADGYKITTKNKIEEWEQESNEFSDDTYHRISAQKSFSVVLKDKKGKFIAMVHSKLER